MHVLVFSWSSQTHTKYYSRTDRSHLKIINYIIVQAVIKMMLAVEAMLKPETGEKDLEVFIDSAMESWKEFHESIHR